MAKKGWFGLSEEERKIEYKRRLGRDRDNLRHLAHALLATEFLSEDKEAEVYARLVNTSIQAYMHANTSERPYEESNLIYRLALAQMKLKREIRKEMEEDELDEGLGEGDY